MRAAVVLAGIAFVVAGCGSAQDKQAADIHAALHPVAVSDVQARLQRAADAGASSSRLLRLTNELLDVTRGDDPDDRRAAIDQALATVAGAGCPLCESALETARS